MRYSRRSASRRWLLLALAVVLVSGTTVLWAGEEKTTEKPSDVDIHVEHWLVLGPVKCPLPAFNDEGESKMGPKDYLEYDHVPREMLKPMENSKIHLAGGQQAVWTRSNADTLGVVIRADTTAPSIAYLATYLEVPRWMKIDLEARGAQPFEIKIDGSSVVKQTEPGKFDDPEEKKKGNAKLGQGKHVLIVKTVDVPADTVSDWRLDVSISPAKDFDGAPSLSLDPSRGMTMGDILDPPQIRSVLVSPDGSYFAMSMSKRTPPEGESEDWVEIRRLRDGKIVKTLKDMSGTSNWQWAPKGNRLSYVTTEDEAGTVRVLDLDTGEIETIVEAVKELSGYHWGPDGSFITYSVTKKPEKDETGVKRLKGVYDRRHHERNKSSLFLSSVPAGMTQKLTAGEHSTFVYDIHPNSKSALIGRAYEDLSKRPYRKIELVLLDLENQSTELLWDGHWLRGATWSPDGKRILVTAGPSTFGDVGYDVPDGTIPNEYDTQAYLFDPETRKADPVTKDFDPTIESAFWPKPGGDIYFVVEETEYVKLYRYNLKRKTFTAIDLDCDVIHRRDAARDKPIAVVTGMSADHPVRVYTVDMGKGKARLLLDPSAERFENVKLGRVEDWNFTTRTGKEIVGRIHYPPDFDPDEKWPCIVYYYGGTSPVSRTFGGRYPKNLWAAHGYVAYVLQPSGATGFGQEYSALHVNDWGKTVAGEIIEGVEEFLEAHEFIDPRRVGCIGASFGGFMTQLLITKTDMFAAAVSHAGISSISSYWGEGYWGYGYNAVSAANSFPWNRPDIYIDQSPLFSADKVNTPLLLLHGTSDTNVPPGESEQMYTALKLLGKEVEYIRVEGQNHFILDYKKRITWSNAILGWFDRWLKDEPEWWNDMYPPIGEKKVEEPGRMGMHRVELEKYGVVLLGEISQQDIEEQLEDWCEEYDKYSPDDEMIHRLKKYIADVDITCVLGTWCSDSRREVPRLWRILEEVGYPTDEVEMLAVGSSRFTKDMPIPRDVFDWSSDVKTHFGVEAVTTVIITRDGQEIGRIVEAPSASLEKDLLEIVKK